MKPILYLEGSSGISGDMTVAALLDLGGSREKLDAVLHSLALEGFHYTVSRRKSHGLDGCDFDVCLQEEKRHHEHEHCHHHEHRNLADVYAVIDRGTMSDNARELAKKIFRIVAEAEAKAHGCPVADVHFHEVGAVDSIVDIVAASVLIDDLGIEECVVRGFYEGGGFVHCQHGDLPIPVPAVLNIAQEYRIALKPTDVQGEMVTPTGIAIAAALRTSEVLPESFTVKKVGIGLGKRDFGRPNFLRAMLIDPSPDPEKILLLEANIDDSSGEVLAFAMEKLFESGARDVHFLPCFMKKNRPAYLLRVIVDQGHLAAVEETMFRTTTTIGLRKIPVERTCMEREMCHIALEFGDIQVKRCSFGSLVWYYPEFESVKKVAEKSGLDFRTVYDTARREAEKQRMQS